MGSPHEVNVLLVGASDATSAMRDLLALRKAQNPKYSLAFLCRECAIPSKGYLSDVLHGRRKLARDYWDKMASALGLQGSAAKCLLLLLKVDCEKEATRRAELLAELEGLKRALKIPRETLPEQLQGMLFALDVFCAFSLFKNQPTHAELLDYFGKTHILELERALRQLMSSGIIKSMHGRFELTDKPHTFLSFTDSKDGVSIVDFLRKSIEDAAASVASWYPRRDVSYFRSAVISVRRHDFERRLAQFKEDMLKAQADFETEDADMLVRFNVQLYPTR